MGPIQHQTPTYLDSNSLVLNTKNEGSIDININNAESQNNCNIPENKTAKLRILLNNNDNESTRIDSVKRNSSHVLAETQNVADVQNTNDCNSSTNSKRFKISH